MDENCKSIKWPPSWTDIQKERACLDVLMSDPIEEDGGFHMIEAFIMLNEKYSGVEVEGENFLKAITMITYNKKVKEKDAAKKAAKKAANTTTTAAKIPKAKVVKSVAPVVTKVKVVATSTKKTK